MIDHCARAELILKEYMTSEHESLISVASDMLRAATACGFHGDVRSVELAIDFLYTWAFDAIDAIATSTDKSENVFRLSHFGVQ